MLVLAMEFSRGTPDSEAGRPQRRPDDAGRLLTLPGRCSLKTEQRIAQDSTEPRPSEETESSTSDADRGSRIASDQLGVARAEDDSSSVLLRKEVIQPHLPVRLPCYDFTPITDPTFDGSLLTVGPPASGVADFRGVTGGVYKARERIHPGVADPGLLATPTSRSRVADCDPN